MTLTEVLDHTFLLIKDGKSISSSIPLNSGKTLKYSKYASPTAFLNVENSKNDYFEVVNNDNTYGLPVVTDIEDLLSLVTEPSIALYEYYYYFLKLSNLKRKD